MYFNMETPDANEKIIQSNLDYFSQILKEIVDLTFKISDKRNVILCILVGDKLRLAVKQSIMIYDGESGKYHDVLTYSEPDKVLEFLNAILISDIIADEFLYTDKYNGI